MPPFKEVLKLKQWDFSWLVDNPFSSMVKVTATFKLMQTLKISLEFQIKSMYLKDDRGSFDSHAKSTYYARTG